MQIIQDHGFMFDGHDIARADVLGQVRAALVAGGVSPAEAEDTTVDRPVLVARAWWRDDAGFVQAHHDGAAPVTVVNIVPPEDEN